MSQQLDTQARLIEALQQPAAYPHPVGQVEHIETHISHLLLAGAFAYKIKKPVDFGFLDFSTLQRRHHFCEEELRLNRRLAPQLYLAVVAIRGTPEQPHFDGDGAVLEYAVKMRRFEQSELLDRQLPDLALCELLARELAAFHQQLPPCDPHTAYGTPERVAQPMLENFEQICSVLDAAPLAQRLDRLRAWTGEQLQQLRPELQQRRADGHIRECHGDLHLGNITRFRGQLCIFDGIEFNPALRWIDSLSDLAFLLMDLHHKGLQGEAAACLDCYLAETGDYQALPLLRLYLVYRAMVRAKVTTLRLAQERPGAADWQQSRAEFESYLELAERLCQPAKPLLMISHGLSGSGKSHFSGWLVQHWPAIRLRSDLERKRLYGLQPAEHSGSGLAGGIYTEAAGEATYVRLAQLAEVIVRAGYSVIVDATFLQRERREHFRQLAGRLGVPFLLLDLQAPLELLQRRIVERQRQGEDVSEADLAVLQSQCASAEPLDAAERRSALVIYSRQFPPEGLLQRITEQLNRDSD
jgi:aminoglycoside phosphotransferase family enzyme/predicted kinase